MESRPDGQTVSPALARATEREISAQTEVINHSCSGTDPETEAVRGFRWPIPARGRDVISFYLAVGYLTEILPPPIGTHTPATQTVSPEFVSHACTYIHTRITRGGETTDTFHPGYFAVFFILLFASPRSSQVYIRRTSETKCERARMGVSSRSRATQKRNSCSKKVYK